MENKTNEILSQQLVKLTEKDNIDKNTIKEIKKILENPIHIPDDTFNNFFLDKYILRPCRKLNDDDLIDMAKLFLQHDYKFTNKFSNIYHLALGTNNLEFIKWSVKNNIVENAATLALRYSVFNNRLDLVDFLSENKANFNFYDPNGKTLLTKSLLKGSIEMFNCLIDKGADVNYRAPGFISDVAPSIFSNYLIYKKIYGSNNSKIDSVEVAEILLKHGYRYFAEDISSAILANEPKLVKWLLEKDYSKYSLESLLNFATKEGNYEISKYLIEKGADVNYKNDKDKSTPLLNCISNNNVELLKLLIENKVNLNSETLDEFNPVVYAISNAKFDCVLCLAENGVKVPEKIINFIKDNDRIGLWNYVNHKFSINKLTKALKLDSYAYFPKDPDYHFEHDFD